MSYLAGHDCHYCADSCAEGYSVNIVGDGSELHNDYSEDAGDDVKFSHSPIISLQVY